MMDNQIQSYFKNKKDIVSVFLFGSYASGKVRSSSDMDLAILFDSCDRDFSNHRVEEYLNDLSRILQKDVHMTAMDLASEELLKQILKKGKCLIVNDAKKLAQFKMKVYSRIVSFQYYHSQMQSGVIQRVMEESQSGR